MIEFIINLGQFIIGCAVLLFIIAAVFAAIIEMYDRVKEKGKADEATKARLKSIEDGES